MLRTAVAWTAGVWGLRDENIRKKIWLLPLRDGIMAVIWVAGLLSDRIKWRGLEYRVKKGLLRPVRGQAQKIKLAND